jgi:hypothetical protein
MAMFAVLNQNNEVINTIVAESLEIAEQATNAACIEFTYDKPATHLSKWDGTNFVSPVVEIVEIVETEETA